MLDDVVIDRQGLRGLPARPAGTVFCEGSRTKTDFSAARLRYEQATIGYAPDTNRYERNTNRIRPASTHDRSRFYCPVRVRCPHCPMLSIAAPEPSQCRFLFRISLQVIQFRKFSDDHFQYSHLDPAYCTANAFLQLLISFRRTTALA